MALSHFMTELKNMRGNINYYKLQLAEIIANIPSLFHLRPFHTNFLAPSLYTIMFLVGSVKRIDSVYDIVLFLQILFGHWKCCSLS